MTRVVVLNYGQL